MMTSTETNVTGMFLEFSRWKLLEDMSAVITRPRRR